MSRSPNELGPGTALYDADWEYQMAFGSAVNELFRQYLSDQGISSVDTAGHGIDFRTQGDCSGTE